MLTDGLGLLGGTLIFMAFGESAYEASSASASAVPSSRSSCA